MDIDSLANIDGMTDSAWPPALHYASILQDISAVISADEEYLVPSDVAGPSYISNAFCDTSDVANRAIVSHDRAKLGRMSTSGATVEEVVYVRSKLDLGLQFLVTVSVTPMVDAEDRNTSKDLSGKVEENRLRRGLDAEKGKGFQGREAQRAVTSFYEKKGRNLPDEIVEKIIARLPFPTLFKARSLSRTWYFKFPLPSQRIRPFPSDFQRHVTAVSHNWATYCPVLFTEAREVVGFDRTVSRWRTVLAFSYLAVLVKQWSSVSCAGSLICLVSDSDSPRGCNLVVSNVLTKSTRVLRRFSTPPYHARLILIGSYAYKVFVVEEYPLPEEFMYADDSGDEDDHHRVQEVHVYDSAVKSWTTRKWTSKRNSIPNTHLNLNHFFRHSAYVDGHMYGIGGEPDKCLRLWRYNVQGDTWTHILERADLKCGERGECGLLLVGDKVMVGVCSPSANVSQDVNTEILETSVVYICRNSIQIFELDLETLQLNEVSTGPPEVKAWVGGSTSSLEFVNSLHISSDANLMYITRGTAYNAVVLTFNPRSLEWGSLSTAGSDCKAWHEDQYRIQGACSFEPGLNPFVMA